MADLDHRLAELTDQLHVARASLGPVETVLYRVLTAALDGDHETVWKALPGRIRREWVMAELSRMRAAGISSWRDGPREKHREREFSVKRLLVQHLESVASDRARS